MELYLHFILINSHFDQEMADQLYDGKESEDNIRNLWEDELKVAEPVSDFKIRNNASYTLAGLFPNDAPFSFDIPEMTICDCTTESGKKMQFAVSKKLLKKTERITGKNGETRMYFYLKDTIDLENPMEGVYIARPDFPEQLKKD
jgi:hypothetical protein